MHQGLTTAKYQAYKGAGPIIVAAAFVLAVGGLAAAAVALCGWQQVKSVGFSLTQRRIEIVCK